MPKTFRISKEEYQFLLDAKKHEAKRSKEQLQYDRKQSLLVNQLRIKQKEREQEFRWKQIQSTEPLEKSDVMLDGKKPIFMVHNDYDQVNLELENLKMNIKLLEEEIKKDEEEVNAD